MWSKSTAALALVCGAMLVPPAPESLVPVRHPQGALHGYLVLRTLQGEIVADGDSIQSVNKGLVTNRTVFRFRDGSIDDEQAVFSQNGVFRLASYHHEQRGKSFPQPITMDIDMSAGRVVVRSTDGKGKPTVDDQRMTLPSDVCDGMVVTLLQNADAKSLPLTLSFVAATPSPRLVKFVISRAGTTRFYVGAVAKTATEFLIKTDVGLLTGFFARLFGKMPPDAHVWIDEADVPGFVKSEAPMTAAGGLMRIELTSPRWQGER
jgi:hypothetical protein